MKDAGIVFAALHALRSPLKNVSTLQVLKSPLKDVCRFHAPRSLLKCLTLPLFHVLRSPLKDAHAIAAIAIIATAHANANAAVIATAHATPTAQAIAANALAALASAQAQAAAANAHANALAAAANAHINAYAAVATAATLYKLRSLLKGYVCIALPTFHLLRSPLKDDLLVRRVQKMIPDVFLSHRLKNKRSAVVLLNFLHVFVLFGC